MSYQLQHKGEVMAQEFGRHFSKIWKPPGTMHHVGRWRFEATRGPAAEGGGLPELEMEQYWVAGKMYMEMTDPATGKTEWVKRAAPDLEALMKESLEASKMGGGGIPEKLKPYFYYQLLGTAEKDGHRVFEIGYYVLNEAGKLVKSISYWGRDFIRADDYLLHDGELKVVLSFAERFQDEAMPVELIEMRMRVEECAYGEQIKIELPPEALQAREMPPPQEESTGK